MKLTDIIPAPTNFGVPRSFHGLGMIPLLDGGATEFPVLDLLDEALGKKTVTITETSEGGEVPFLKLENTGAHPVLILDGEELVGGKQNRIVNTTILVLAGSSIKIPVSCMEAGRWQRQQQDFDSGKAIFRAKSRAVQKASVTLSLRAEGSFRSDQGAVWNEVSESLHELRAPSPTSDFRAGREKVAHRIEEFVEAIRPVDRQVGAIFMAPAGILGGELLATPELFANAVERIVRSFAFEVLASPDLDDVPLDKAQDWWQKIMDAPMTKHTSPGAGEDIRFDALGLIGSGLLWHDTLVHLSCFPTTESSQGSGHSTRRRAPASERRNRMNRK